MPNRITRNNNRTHSSGQWMWASSLADQLVIQRDLSATDVFRLEEVKSRSRCTHWMSEMRSQFWSCNDIKYDTDVWKDTDFPFFKPTTHIQLVVELRMGGASPTVPFHGVHRDNSHWNHLARDKGRPTNRHVTHFLTGLNTAALSEIAAGCRWSFYDCSSPPPTPLPSRALTHIGEFCAAGEIRPLPRLAAATEGGEVECALPCIKRTAVERGQLLSQSSRLLPGMKISFEF